MPQGSKKRPGAGDRSACGGKGLPIPLRGDWTVVDGVRMHARIRTDAAPPSAPVVVLVHGLVISSRYMAPTGELLARRFRVLAPDLPGFGLSGPPPEVLGIRELADALARWMDAKGVRRASLLGNSLGCQVIASLAAQRPERVDRVVLVSPTFDPAARSVLPQIGRWLADAPRERPSLWLRLVPDSLRAGPRRGLATFLRGLEDPIEKHLPRIPAPALVVRGTRDPIVPARWAAQAASLLPRGRLVVLPGAPHAPNYSAPRALVRVVAPFLEAASGTGDVEVR